MAGVSGPEGGVGRAPLNVVRGEEGEGEREGGGDQVVVSGGDLRLPLGPPFSATAGERGGRRRGGEEEREMWRKRRRRGEDEGEKEWEVEEGVTKKEEEGEEEGEEEEEE